MDVQNIKNTENLLGKSNYMWLCTKRTTLIWISTRDEFKIRQALTKVIVILFLKKLISYWFRLFLIFNNKFSDNNSTGNSRNETTSNLARQ